MNYIEDYVSYKAARLLKYLGYKNFCRYFYACKTSESDVCITMWSPVGADWNDKKQVEFSTCKYEIHCSAPTLAEAAKWLRSRGYHVNVSYALATKDWCYTITKLNGGYVSVKIQHYPTYEEALSAGIDKVLEITIDPFISDKNEIRQLISDIEEKVVRPD